ncbi:hypothetical protein V8C86DRAFT_1459914 [Haematococcus lacustris]
MAVACEEAASLAAARCLARAVGWQAGDEASGGGAARAAAGGAAGAGRPTAPGSARCSPTVGFCLLQRGVLRTNCIDCLDRTNVAQYACGLAGFGRQLFLLGLSDIPHVDDDSSIARVLSSQYEFMGDSLAMQYGGSDAHSVFFQRQKGGWEASTLGKDVITSIRRFYSNSITDAEKQDAINLFLGNYVPSTPGQPELWELENDVYLHATDPSTGRRKRDSLLAGSWPSGPPHSLSGVTPEDQIRHPCPEDAAALGRCMFKRRPYLCPFYPMHGFSTGFLCLAFYNHSNHPRTNRLLQEVPP